MKVKIAAILSLLFYVSIFSYIASAETFMNSALAEYDQGDYSKAIALLKQAMADEGLAGENGVAHYNLGSFYFKDNQLGSAIFHYKKALQLMPRDGDVKYNLEYAQKKAQDKIENLKASWIDAISLKNLLSKKEQIYFLAFLHMAFWIFLIINSFYKTEWLRWSSFSLAILFCGFMVIYINDFAFQKDFGVVTVSEANVYSATGQNNILLFSLHSGAEFEITDKLGNEWVQIELADRKKGWIKASSIIF
ncbi:MAG: hypothetical protein A2504_01600 [Bdellovibrionales bacterium RIFOXYD12_FULL_39_22]|nr:MAG: hypothetical protein A2385_04125 [Bdellovibrionales bacterium RIFOXYB1_FULL_39_21]OFZ42399.1 MAG: hypothetical protein A2485_15370 [Bdellovibrionales bacterium RIFOXYC12_FULL_39_17]OFZ46300.1 MAG: hypothetical protein A2404_13645 [Bdellovibrionales bacterium RIFOXYC1_FULL_39_130]OFZ75193.1 MAG: hypothetical protein A2560_15700 [Bdellovibrionales bacterium RIFOXYD1_FULL_39_84]OFZ93187.1 MAG: hypothetical protein A2504_01600 [Bdellovibrionales bacterium RIFOXYD12_FULL_39_22]HLE11102.1 te